MNYQDIQKANSELQKIDLKGKDYAMVAERVTAFRKLFPEGFIMTDIISHDGQTVMMRAKAGYYCNGNPFVLGTGYAQEVKGKGMVNGTSYIENCETSAVGRALGFLGLGINGGGICSAEELANAILAQKQPAPQPTKPATPETPQHTSERNIRIKELIVKAKNVGKERSVNNDGLMQNGAYTPWSVVSDDLLSKAEMWIDAVKTAKEKQVKAS